ncbi:MAG: ATP-binding protein, partial [Pseudomonadota bacterium]
RILGSTIKKQTLHWEMKLVNELPLIKGNSQQLEQVFINVMQNALLSLPDKHHRVSVESSLDKEQRNLLVQVIDQGTGITEENLLRVTEPFFTTRLNTGGTGLGLSISKSIIENHKGSISFESSIGIGTMVTIKLPII